MISAHALQHVEHVQAGDRRDSASKASSASAPETLLTIVAPAATGASAVSARKGPMVHTQLPDHRYRPLDVCLQRHLRHTWLGAPLRERALASSAPHPLHQGVPSTRERPAAVKFVFLPPLAISVDVLTFRFR
ncbi:hypothetical protein PtA15_12A513 [Puccinia triticina]|uniref:Uncharacterized protein n=1 Tax=Puccinia triticina TaxID=208348 RepID=A0ABY7D1Q4_9BASI|nr:uncharacterized protein PtA15_12A513 [Puccinia triticina]WAQ90523.1 hypothetical protein PtA15_12A513 [Puccinia triticina]